MSIQRRLAISITFVLLCSLSVGFALTYSHVISKVRTELQAALAVGASSARNAIEDQDSVDDPMKRLRRVVADFNGDRHLEAILTGPNGRILAQSHLLTPDDPAPAWFFKLVASTPPTQALALPPALDAAGGLTLRTDPQNEVAEAWSDTKLTLVIMAVFFAMVLALAFMTIRGALAPLRDVCAALERVGKGDYSARIAPHIAHELAPLRQGFNAMTSRLDEISVQNRALNEQIMSLQEEERAELARDLHDDVAPFLFGVGADVAMIRQYLAKGTIDEVSPRAEAIADSVKHMQRHLKDVLRRLAPGALLDLGLAGAIEDLTAFWTSRQPKIGFTVAVTGEPLDPPLNAIAFRVVQESISNAVRHAAPRTIDVMVDVDDEQATIVVEDDGRGFPQGAPTMGFGLTGMQERVRTVGGTPNRNGATSSCRSRASSARSSSCRDMICSFSARFCTLISSRREVMALKPWRSGASSCAICGAILAE